MSLLTLLPILALVPVLVVTLTALIRGKSVFKHAWIIAAVFCVAFTGWSLAAVVAEGPVGFWPVHTQTLWGNQVWFDLLMALTMGWVLILPRARRMGMNSPLWLLFILCSGSIGFSAMLARMLFLEQKKA